MRWTSGGEFKNSNFLNLHIKISENILGPPLKKLNVIRPPHWKKLDPRMGIYATSAQL